MDICEIKTEETSESILKIVSDVVQNILDKVCEPPVLSQPLIDQNENLNVIVENQMEIEDKESSTSSSSEDEELEKQLLKLNEESEEECVNPQEKFITKNEKKTKILYEDETKENREKRYGFFGETAAILQEPKRKIGVINSVFENTIVIKPLIKEVLDLDNVVFLKDEILGKIDDVFGNVENPFYSILADPYIKTKFQGQSFKVLDDVFVLEAKVKVILQSSINEIKKKIGCDASNVFDEEINEKEMEFSDDEKEHNLKNKKKKKTTEKEEHSHNNNKHFQNQKERKFEDKQKNFGNRHRNDHTNQVYGRNVADFNFMRPQQMEQMENYGYYENNEPQLNQQGFYNNFYGSGMTGQNNNYFGPNQVYHPEYYPSQNNTNYPQTYPQVPQQNFFGRNYENPHTRPPPHFHGPPHYNKKYY